MNLPQQLAKHFREVYFGGNWTASSLSEHVKGLTWQHATTQVYSFNTIAALVFHSGYYVAAVLKVLRGAPLDASDKFSFDLPPINSNETWEALLNKTLLDAGEFARMVEELPNEKLWDVFWDEKYGNYYRNIQGVIEHTHYHLGQIVLLKKMIAPTMALNK